MIAARGGDDALAEPAAVGLTQVCEDRALAAGEIVDPQPAPCERPTASAPASQRPAQILAPDPHQARVDAPAQEGNALADRRQARGVFLQLEGEPLAQELANPRPATVQRGLVVGEDQQVVHVPHVADRSQIGDDELVERVEVEVREVLAREVADRKPPTDGTVRHRMPDDAFDQLEQARVDEALGEAVEKHAVIDTVEERPYVEFQEELAAPGEALRPGDGPVGALATPARVAVVHEHPLEVRLHDAAHGVVDDAIAERSDGDLAPLGVVDGEGRVRAGTVDAVEEFSLDREDLALDVAREAAHVRRPCLAPRRPAGGGQEVVEGDDPVEETAEAFHDRACACLSQPPVMRPASSS